MLKLRGDDPLLLMPAVFIYGLLDPQTDRVYYVGKTDNLVKRLAAHITRACSPRTYRVRLSQWILALLSAGVRPKIKVLEEVDQARWQVAERAWIARLRESEPLLNISPGGHQPFVYPKPRTIAQARATFFDGGLFRKASSGCWLPAAQASFLVAGKARPLRVAAWLLVNGEEPRSELTRLCDTDACLSPYHHRDWDTEERFWSLVVRPADPNDVASCWGWLGNLDLHGYPAFYWCNNRSGRAHKYSAFLHLGTAKDIRISHLCENRSCCNPLHLGADPAFALATAKIVAKRAKKTRYSEAQLKEMRGLRATNPSLAGHELSKLIASQLDLKARSGKPIRSLEYLLDNLEEWQSRCDA